MRGSADQDQDHYAVRTHTLDELLAVRRELAANAVLTDDLDAHLHAVNLEIDRRMTPPKHPVGMLTSWELRNYRESLEYYIETTPDDGAGYLRARLAEVISEQQTRVGAQRRAQSGAAVRS
jgi:hypothetical protein